MAVSRLDVVAPLIGKHRSPAYPAFKLGLITAKQARLLGVSQGLINRGRHG